jgi:dTDP-4-dehydrorhamnose reductase
MRILVIGGSGYLGMDFIRRYSDRHEIHGTYNENAPLGSNYHHLDISDGEATRELILKLEPEVTLLYATADSKCNDEEFVKKINVEGTRNVLGGCCRADSRVISMSSDYIFDGCSGPYGVGDLPNPINMYGATKAEAEWSVMAYPANAILRTSVVYGGNETNRGFRLVSGLINKLRSGKEFTAFEDMYRTPTYVEDLSDLMLRMCESDFKGVAHVGSPELISVSDFAEQVCDIFDLDKRLLLKDTFGDRDPSSPKRLGLRVQETQEQFDTQFKSTLEGLNAMKNLSESKPL